MFDQEVEGGRRGRGVEERERGEEGGEEGLRGGEGVLGGEEAEGKRVITGAGEEEEGEGEGGEGERVEVGPGEEGKDERGVGPGEKEEGLVGGFVGEVLGEGIERQVSFEEGESFVGQLQAFMVGS